MSRRNTLMPVRHAQVRVPGDRPELRHHAEGVRAARAAGQDHAVVGAVLRLLQIRGDVHVRHRLRRIRHFQSEFGAAANPCLDYRAMETMLLLLEPFGQTDSHVTCLESLFALWLV